MAQSRQEDVPFWVLPLREECPGGGLSRAGETADMAALEAIPHHTSRWPTQRLRESPK